MRKEKSFLQTHFITVVFFWFPVFDLLKERHITVVRKVPFILNFY